MTCCQGRFISDIDELRNYIHRLTERNTRLRYFRQYQEHWLNTNWPICYHDNVLCFHADVGNVELLKKKKMNVNIIISGFCVAGEAGLAYVRDVLDLNKRNDNKIIDYYELKALHSFGTRNMKEGTIDIIKSHNIHNTIGQGLTPEEAFKKAKTGDIPLLLTQALCPIIANHTSKSTEVWRAIRDNTNVRKFIKNSLTKWWQDIYYYYQQNNELMLYLMGLRSRGRAELQKLLSYTIYNVIKISHPQA